MATRIPLRAVTTGALLKQMTSPASGLIITAAYSSSLMQMKWIISNASGAELKVDLCDSSISCWVLWWRCPTPPPALWKKCRDIILHGDGQQRHLEIRWDASGSVWLRLIAWKHDGCGHTCVQRVAGVVSNWAIRSLTWPDRWFRCLVSVNPRPVTFGPPKQETGRVAKGATCQPFPAFLDLSSIHPSLSTFFILAMHLRTQQQEMARVRNIRTICFVSLSEYFGLIWSKSHMRSVLFSARRLHCDTLNKHRDKPERDLLVTLGFFCLMWVDGPQKWALPHNENPYPDLCMFLTCGKHCSNHLRSRCLNLVLTHKHRAHWVLYALSKMFQQNQSSSKAANENKLAGLHSLSTLAPQTLLSLPFPPLILSPLSLCPGIPPPLWPSPLKPLSDSFLRAWMNK